VRPDLLLNQQSPNEITEYIILNYIQRQQITSSQHRKKITVNTDEEEESSLVDVLIL
jgi:hypothetical protein